MSDKSQTSQTQDVTDVGHAEIVFDNKSDRDSEPVKPGNTHCVVDRQHYEGLLIRMGQYEAERRYLLEYKGDIEAKSRELSEAKEKAKAQNKILKEAGEKIRELQAENERLKIPWWKRIFKK